MYIYISYTSGIIVVSFIISPLYNSHDGDLFYLKDLNVFMTTFVHFVAVFYHHLYI